MAGSWSCPARGIIQWTIPLGHAVEGMGAYVTTLERVNGSDGIVFLTCLVFSQTAKIHFDFKKVWPSVYWVHLERSRKEATVVILEDNVCMLCINIRSFYVRACIVCYASIIAVIIVNLSVWYIILIDYHSWRYIKSTIVGDIADMYGRILICMDPIPLCTHGI